MTRPINQRLLFMAFLMVTFLGQGQSYIGFLTDNYSGVNSVIANPANIADSRFKTDIHLAGVSVFAANDYLNLSLTDALESDFDFELDTERSPSTDNNGKAVIDVMGPAFMFNLDKKSALALFTRVRAVANISEINGETIDNFENEIDANNDFSVNEGDAFVTAHSWAEYGLSYGRVLMNKETHFLKGGLSLKYLRGIGNAYAVGENITVDFDADGTPLPGGLTTGSLNSTGDVAYGRSDDFEADDYEFELPDANGFGVDLGFVYEWRPDYKDYEAGGDNGEHYNTREKNKYKLKMGLSITDLGSVNYKDGVETSYNIANSISEDDFESQDGIEEALDNLYTETGTVQGIKAKLPTALHFNADWSFNPHFYLNLNTDLALTGKQRNTPQIANIASLTPRFESKWFSFFVPLSLVQHNGFQFGAGLRFGPLYVGSGSLGSLLGNNAQGGDFYTGLKIPVYQRQPKDRDGDGIIDKFDECPKKPGPAENQGCPWEDTDGDGVLDNDDRCKEEAGPQENAGCPWTDSDGDGLLDNEDACPQEAGPSENQGCPYEDSDGDGVLDKDDACVNEVGTVANNGCPEPEVTETVQKTLNEYAKTILFNSGKATIKNESLSVLVDIIGILNEYPAAKFTVEGHTDSIGSYETNQRLSEARANAVRDYLIKNGVDATRLQAIGYGERKPIATNMYKDGRLKNRRVEINLVK